MKKSSISSYLTNRKLQILEDSPPALPRMRPTTVTRLQRRPLPRPTACSRRRPLAAGYLLRPRRIAAQHAMKPIGNDLACSDDVAECHRQSRAGGTPRRFPVWRHSIRGRLAEELYSLTSFGSVIINLTLSVSFASCLTCTTERLLKESLGCVCMCVSSQFKWNGMEFRLYVFQIDVIRSCYFGTN